MLCPRPFIELQVVYVLVLFGYTFFRGIIYIIFSASSSPGSSTVIMMEKEIHNKNSISSIKAIHLAHRQEENMNGDNNVAPSSMMTSLLSSRDDALLKLQQQQMQNDDLMQQAQEIYPRIYLGPFSVARDARTLTRLGITHIVCLSAEGPATTTLPPPLLALPNSTDDDYTSKKMIKIPATTVSRLNHPLVEVECTLQNGAQQLVAVLPSCWRFVRDALGLSLRPPNKNKNICGGEDDGIIDDDNDDDDDDGDYEYENSTNNDSTSRQKNVPDSGNTPNDSSTRVLIHCLHGKTRSAAIAACIVAALSSDDRDFRRAYEHIKEHRDVLVPEEWHEELQIGVSELIL